jgi:hypothetical protein
MGRMDGSRRTAETVSRGTECGYTFLLERGYDAIDGGPNLLGSVA